MKKAPWRHETVFTPNLLRGRATEPVRARRTALGLVLHPEIPFTDPPWRFHRQTAWRVSDPISGSSITDACSTPRQALVSLHQRVRQLRREYQQPFHVILAWRQTLAAIVNRQVLAHEALGETVDFYRWLDLMAAVTRDHPLPPRDRGSVAP